MSVQEVCLTLDDKLMRRIGRLPTNLEICYCEDAPYKATLTLHREDVGELTFRLTDEVMQEIVELFTEIVHES